MFSISLAQPQGELRVGEVPIREGDDPLVDGKAVQQHLHLGAGDGEGEAVPLVIGQAVGEALHPGVLGVLGASYPVVQPYLVLAPAGLQLQVPAPHHT